MRLRTKAPAKINVCLFLGPLRPDGRHELVSVMQSVSLADRVTLEHGEDADAVECRGVDGPNLALQALTLFRERTGWDEGPLRIVVDKRIPVAGGMAGGSADAGAVLRLARSASGLGSAELLHEIGAQLGADVPAQVRPGRVLATGTGTEIERVPGVAPYGVVTIPDAAPLSTADVYREADRLGLPRGAEELAGRLGAVRAALPDLPDALCVNDLEAAALSLRPDLGARLDLLRAHGADVAMVSGSGPTVLGLFHDRDAAKAAAGEIAGAIAAKPVGKHAGEVLPA